MSLTLPDLLTAAAILSAAGALLAAYNKTYDWVRRQERQDEAIAELREEQRLLTFGVLACLKGLHEQGCNGPVTDAIRAIETYVNKKAHE